MRVECTQGLTIQDLTSMLLGYSRDFLSPKRFLELDIEQINNDLYERV